MDKLIEKLKKILSKLGVEEDKIESIVSEVQSEDEPESKGESEEVEIKAEDESTPESSPNESQPDEPESPVAPEGDGEPAPAVEPEPVEPAPELPSPEGEGEVPPAIEGEVNPAEITPENIEPSPSPDPTPAPEAVEPDPTIEFQAKIDELSEVNSALKSRIDALEEALKKSGIMEEEVANSSIGIDESKVPANNPIDDPMESVLGEINMRRHG